MGKIYYLMGKSSSGKDTIYEKLLTDEELNLHPVILYTTRPIRDGEQDGVTYHYVTEGTLESFRAAGKVIEERCYNTIYGPWYYFTVDDGQIDLEKKRSLAIGTLDSYMKLKEYFGPSNLVPLYIEVEDGERLIRAIRREQTQEVPKYEEMCRRFLADAKDFSEERLAEAEISVRYFNNESLEACLAALREKICMD